ncbi:MAG TPA: YetF domain-containing protein [Candidatus Limnocylindrales bacterium]|jgi:uncharacterized membrane protein YcaP (DUF421 family)|nr:YetF domain-containing protein [Candidatus Limnocylindrales bacterium]
MELTDALWHLGAPPLELVVRTIVVYIVFLGALRLSGKRELGQFTLFDLALVLLAANAVQPAVTGQDTSLLGGLIILVTIFGMNKVVAAAREHVPFIRRALEFEPTVIGRDGAWLPDAVDREELDDGDLEAALREHGVDSLARVKLATLEQDGSISIVTEEGTARIAERRRRRRYRRPAAD